MRGALLTGVPVGNGRFPFRGEHTSTQANQALRSITHMVRDQVDRMNWLGLGSEALDEIHSNAMVHLWECALPQFDSSRGTKLSTFLYQCARTFILNDFRGRWRKAKSHKAISPIDPDLIATYVGESEFLDDRIASLAADVIRHPSEYMNSNLARVFTARVQHPEMPIKDLAKLLGYTHARSLSSILTRIKDIISELEIVTYASDTPGESD